MTVDAGELMGVEAAPPRLALPQKILARMSTVLLAERLLAGTALNKLLFFADALHQIRHHRTISGSGYTRLEYGTAALGMAQVKDYLLAGGYATRSVGACGDSVQSILTLSGAMRDHARLELVRGCFWPEELAALEEISARLGDLQAVRLSELVARTALWTRADWFGELDLAAACEDAGLRRVLAEAGILV